MKSLIKILFLSSSLFVAWSYADSPKQVWPEDSAQMQLTREVVEIMQEKHFRKQKLDDALSSMLLDNYLKALDPGRMIFLQSDIDEFNHFRNKIDDELAAGKLTSPQLIYQRYYDRYSARLNWILNEIAPVVKNETFTGNDEIEVDRKNSPWPTDMQAADLLWMRYLKNDILGLRLADKPTDNIGTTLTRRFQTQLDRLNKQTPMDNFEIFMNAYTELYDPHTNYMSPKSAENFDISMALSLEGIGAVLEKDDEYTKVTSLVSSGPADKQGELKASDHIIAIAQGKNSEDWTDVVGWRLDEVVDLIRGKADTWVRLQIKRGDNLIKTIAIKREKVKLEDLAASKKIIELPGSTPGMPLHIAVITVPNFYLNFEAMRRGDPDAKSTTRDVARILNELRDSPIDGIVIDLRDNGGGSLAEATQLTDLFIDQGPVVQILNSENEVDRSNRAVGSVNYNGPLLVLVNHLSASASEIFAGAIQDYQRGLIVGDQTFGKGTVQTLVPLDQGKLKITEAKFYRVSGDSTQHRGVIPDITFPALMPYDDIGESALEHALPWDQIQPAPHYRFADLESLTPALKINHDQRMKNNIEYDFLLKRSQWIEEQKKRKTIPLNLAKRDQLKKEEDAKILKMTNDVRAAKGLPKFITMSEIEDDAQKKRDAKNPQDDFLLMESAKILGDFIEKQPNQNRKLATSQQQTGG
ncbi:MAG TPA: carboxy terminal-processing peptidase [Pseudomonadales bacterium]|nr:carboxy terminal-processing peptidase [Pseudomonadales bacterium]